MIDFEYLKSDSDEAYEKLAKPFLKDIDFAFFAVNLGYSKRDYEAITPRERSFIYKAWENKIISENTHMYNAVFTAIYNANRPKNKRALKLWKKANTQKADFDVIEENISILKEVDKKDGNTWINLVYNSNGFPKTKKEGDVDV